MDKWTDEQFACWLAGFFDGEGCIYLNRKALNSSEITLAGTEGEVITAIQRRLGYGVITKVTYSSEKWKPKYALRIRCGRDVQKFLEMVSPFLVIKAANAAEALARSRKVEAEMTRREENYAKARELLAQGRSCLSVAKELGMGRPMVSQIKCGYQAKYRPKKDDSYTRNSHETTTSKHTAEFPTTVTRQLKTTQLISD